jgi:hypothetical protein
MQTRLTLFVLLLLLFGSALRAQQQSTATFYPYDSRIGWGESTYAVTMWQTGQKHTDSAVVVQKAGFQTFRDNYYDLHRALYLPDGWFHQMPCDLNQYATSGMTPERAIHFVLVDNDYVAVSESVTTFMDSLITEHIEYLLDSKGDHYDTTVYHFTYDEHRGLTSYEVAFVRDGQRTLKEVTNFYRRYDAHDRLAMLTTYRSKSKPLAIQDSQVFYYNLDNTLRTAVMWQWEYGIQDTKTIAEFQSWHSCEQNAFILGNESIAVGGAGFNAAKYTVIQPRFDDTSTSIVSKTYNASGQVASMETLFYPDLHKVRREYAYYGNGDLLSIRDSTGETDTLFTLKQYINEYSGNNLLVSSDRYENTSPQYHVLFTYPTEGFSEATDPVNDNSSIGRHVTFGDNISHLVTLTDLLGKQTYRERTSGIFHINLPSGLYFISIDGGKPRKHLIP